MDVDYGGRGFWWTSGFARRVFHRDVPAVTGPVPLHYQDPDSLKSLLNTRSVCLFKLYIGILKLTI